MTDDGYWLLAIGYSLLAALTPERSGAPIVMASVVDTCYMTLVTCALNRLYDRLRCSSWMSSRSFGRAERRLLSIRSSYRSTW